MIRTSDSEEFPNLTIGLLAVDQGFPKKIAGELAKKTDPQRGRTLRYQFNVSTINLNSFSCCLFEIRIQLIHHANEQVPNHSTKSAVL